MKNNMNFTKILSLALALCCLFSLLCIFSSCENTSGNNSGDDDKNSSGDDNGEPGYTVKVVNYKNEAMSDVIVNLLDKNGEQLEMKLVDKNGSAKFSLDKGEYTVSLAFTDKNASYYYDPESCVLSAEKTETTIVLYNSLSSASKIFFVVDGVDNEVDSYRAVLGGTLISLKANETAYFIFTPTKSGYYKISASDPSASVGYHGAPTFPMINNVANMEESGAFHLNVKDSNIGTGGTGTSQYILSVSASTDASVVFKVERESDYVKDIIDEPWNDVKPSKVLKKYILPSGAKLTDLDISDPSLKVVFNESDGYYHLGSANGPVVLVRITTASDHIESFTKMCETDRLGAYLYDEDGKFLRKESFNELIGDYAEICDETAGVCPLDEDLAYMIKTVGDYKGWWNYERGTQIFEDIIVSKDTAWLFACCYIA